MSLPPDELPEGVCEVQEETDIWLRQVQERDPASGEVGPSAFARSTEERNSGKPPWISGTLRSKQTARQAFDVFVAGGNGSAGTWGVSVAEIHALHLRCIDDSVLYQPKLKHASLDLTPRPPAGVHAPSSKATRLRLATAANALGCLYSPSEEVGT
jgi:hypothetical protein